MTYSVTYTKQFSISQDPAYQPSQVRMKLLVTGVVGFVDKGMFVYQVDQAIGQPYYSHVAAPIDLQDYYYNNIANKQFVRFDYVDRIYDTASLAEADAEAIHTALQLLCADMVELQAFNEPVTLTVTAS